MIEITDGFTCISAGSDRIEDQAEAVSHWSSDSSRAHSATGARVVIEFRCNVSLAAGQWVTARYDFAGDGNLREGMGIAAHIRTVVRWGRTVQYHYRFSHWIAPSELMNFVARGERSCATLPMPGVVHEARAIDPSPA